MKVAIRSTLQHQVPAFVAEENPLFMEFLDAYYEWLEQDGMSIDYIRNALNFLDVDQTLDRFINNFWEEVKDIPLEAKANRRLLAKHIYDLYQSKGTIKSYKLLFRILYNEDVEIYTPKEDMLRVSDGKWQVNQTIRSTALSGDPFGLIGLTLRQGDASVLVQNVIEISYGSQKFYDIHIEPGTVVGTMVPGEAYANWTDENNDNQTITVDLPVAPTDVEIRSKGRYYQAGTLVDLADTDGTDFQCRIGEIGVGSITGVMILDGGSGYTVGELLSVDNENTGGVGLRITISGVDESGAVTKLNIVNPGQAYSDLPVITGAKGGQFLAYSNNIGRILNLSTTSVGRDHEVQDTETTFVQRGIITNPVGVFEQGESLTLLDDTVLTENYGAFLTEDGDRIINEDVNSSSTPATIGLVSGNWIELHGQATRRAVGLEATDGFVLTEDGEVMINEVSSADLNRRTIVGVTSGATCRILDMDVADILIGPGVLALTGSRYANLDGMVSEYTKRIQDSKFYQDFSYVIKSAQSIDTYKNVVQKLIHPAGFAMFGEIHAETKLNIGLRVIEQFESLVNIATYVLKGFDVSDAHYTLIQQESVFETYEALDRWKFPASASVSDSIYQSNTPMDHFGDLKFTDIYEYDGDTVIGYKASKKKYTRGSEIRVNGTLI